MLEARPHLGCGYLTKRSTTLPAALASYTPVCVKDPFWDTVLSQPTGRCATRDRKVGVKAGEQIRAIRFGDERAWEFTITYTAIRIDIPLVRCSEPCMAQATDTSR